LAIYHLHIKTISRGAGSAKAKADYIVREGKYQSDKAEVAYTASGNMPEWAADDPKKYWKAADDNERANGRLFVHAEFALPAELTADQRQELAAEFCRDIAQTSQGKALPYSMAIHKGRGEDNPHCHLMINERINDGITRKPDDWFRQAHPKDPTKGGARKTAELHSKIWLISTRQKWANKSNDALAKYGHKDVKIDHRTLKAQGIDREPQYHLGPAAAAMERKRKNGNGNDSKNKPIRQAIYEAVNSDIVATREAAARIKNLEAQAQAQAKIEAQEKAKALAEAQAKIEAEAKAKAEAETKEKALAEIQTKDELEVREKARAEAEKAQAEARQKSLKDFMAQADTYLAEIKGLRAVEAPAPEPPAPLMETQDEAPAPEPQAQVEAAQL
jgi:hypothetical protein